MNSSLAALMQNPWVLLVCAVFTIVGGFKPLVETVERVLRLTRILIRPGSVLAQLRIRMMRSAVANVKVEYNCLHFRNRTTYQLVRSGVLAIIFMQMFFFLYGSAKGSVFATAVTGLVGLALLVTLADFAYENFYYAWVLDRSATLRSRLERRGRHTDIKL